MHLLPIPPSRQLIRSCSVNNRFPIQKWRVPSRFRRHYSHARVPLRSHIVKRGHPTPSRRLTDSRDADTRSSNSRMTRVVSLMQVCKLLRTSMRSPISACFLDDYLIMVSFSLMIFGTMTSRACDRVARREYGTTNQGDWPTGARSFRWC